MDGKQQLINTFKELESVANKNECNMSSPAMGAVACAINWITKYISRPKEYSLEEASLILNISSRHLRRLMKKNNVNCRRRGFAHVYLLQADIDKLMSVRTDIDT